MSKSNYKAGDNPIRDNLQNQFQQLGAKSTQPEELREEVFNTLDTLTLLGDVVDLFTTKFSASKIQLIDSVELPKIDDDEAEEDINE